MTVPLTDGEEALLARLSLPQIVDLTTALIAEPSENPGGDEASTVAVLAEACHRAGLSVEVVEAAPGRPNLVATLPGGSDGPTLLFLGHSDVVPAGTGWSGDPFAARIVGDRLVGRGATDMKGGLAAIVAAMAIITVAPIAVLLAGTAPDSAMRIFLALGACGYLGSYLTGCIAAPVLLHRIGESTTAAVVLSVTTTVILSALFGNAIYFAVRDGAGLLGIYGALISIGLLYTIGLKIFAPQRVNAVGIYDETQRADLLNSVPFR